MHLKMLKYKFLFIQIIEIFPDFFLKEIPSYNINIIFYTTNVFFLSFHLSKYSELNLVYFFKGAYYNII